jgi:CBS domain-containing protein
MAEVASVMAEYGVGAVLVLDGDALVGIVTDRDLVVRGVAARQGPAAMVEGVMTARPVTVQGNADLDEAVALFAKGGFRRLPVLEDDQLAGMLTVDDVLLGGVEFMRAVLAPVLSEARSGRRP